GGAGLRDDEDVAALFGNQHLCASAVGTMMMAFSSPIMRPRMSPSRPPPPYTASVPRQQQEKIDEVMDDAAPWHLDAKARQPESRWSGVGVGGAGGGGGGGGVVWADLQSPETVDLTELDLLFDEF
ncbi:hypothetical protein LTR28_007266, partial [Elasticomyces elasticus]